MQNTNADTFPSLIPKLKPKSSLARSSFLLKIQKFKQKLKLLKSNSTERKFFLCGSTRQPVNCSDLGYPYIPIIKNSYSLTKLVNNQPSQYLTTEKRSKPSSISVSNSNFHTKNSTLDQNKHQYRNYIQFSKQSPAVKISFSTPKLLLTKKDPEAKQKIENFVYETLQKVTKNKESAEYKEAKPSPIKYFTSRHIERQSNKKENSLLSKQNLKMFAKRSKKSLNYRKVDNQYLKPENHDKLIECNDSIISSLSSTVIERIPRYK